MSRLLAQAKLLDQLVIFAGILALEIIEQLAALVDHFKQAAPGVMILHVRLEVVGKSVDAGREQRNLNLRRPRVARRPLMLLDDLRLFYNAYPHSLLSLCLFAKGGHFTLKSESSTSNSSANQAQLDATRRLGRSTPAASISPVPRNRPSSPKTTTLPFSELTETAWPCRNLAASCASSAKRGRRPSS